MRSPLQPLTLALSQFDDPALLGVVWRSVLGALLAFALAGFGLARAALALAGPHGVLGDWSAGPVAGWFAGALGAIGAGLLGWLLFLPVAGLIATLFTDRIAAAVERRFYPTLPPARPASLAQQGWDGLVLGIQVLALQVLALLLTPLLPGVSLLAGWGIAAWTIGRGLFVAVAMRRIGRPAALALYRRERAGVVLHGLLIAAASLVPVFNLAVPVLGVAALVHLFHAGMDSRMTRDRGADHGPDHGPDHGLSLSPPV